MITKVQKFGDNQVVKNKGKFLKQVRDILISNLDKYSHLEYYEVVIEEIERHQFTKPDISIESCKSLIEGISKIILRKLDNSLNDRAINKLDFQPLYKQAMTKLSEYNTEFEIDFVNRSNSLIHLLCEIRNEKGDLSHGRIAPKVSVSNSGFAILVSRMTDGILFYILSHFFNINSLDELFYKDYPEFNDMLDEEIELGGKLKYSLALFEQDLIEYSTRLEEFLVQNGDIDE